MTTLKYKQTISDMSSNELKNEINSLSNISHEHLSDEVSLKIHLILSELESRTK